MEHRRRRSEANTVSVGMSVSEVRNSRPDLKREKHTFYSAARMPRCLESEQIPRQLEELP